MIPPVRSDASRRWARRLRWAAPLTIALVFAVASHAQQPAARQARAQGSEWTALTAAQQDVLRPLRKEWGQLDTERRAKWIAIADRFHQLPPGEQSRVQARMVEWTRMSPSERGQVRQNFTEAQRAVPNDRKARWEAYNALPADKRREWAARSGAEHRSQGEATAATNAPLQARTPSDSGRRAKPVSPTLSQAQSGATTRLMSKSPSPPTHLKHGQPKIAATPALVDRTTLLPKPGARDATARDEQSESPLP